MTAIANQTRFRIDEAIASNETAQLRSSRDREQAAVSHQPRPTSLLTERIGDGQSNCLEHAVLQSRPDKDELVFLDDQSDRDGNGAGHVVIRDIETGRIWDPNDGPAPGDPADWHHDSIESFNDEERTTPPFGIDRYTEVGAAEATDVKRLLELSPSARSAAVEQVSDPELTRIANLAVADPGQINPSAQPTQ